MPLNQHIFREYDIRGVVGVDLGEKALEELGWGIGSFLRKTSGKSVVVGHDNRKSSHGFAKALVEGLRASGCDVTFIGLSTTPMLYFAVCKDGFDGGIEVTASHNPPEFNGLKATQKNAFPIFGDQIQEIRKIIGQKNFASGKGKLSKKDFLASYKKMLVQKIRLSKKLKIVVDTGNGTAGMVAPQLLKAWGCEVIEQHTVLDNSFPNHLPDPAEPKNIQDLLERVKIENADLGLGFDGDCDRLGLVSGSGEIVFADKVIAILSKGFLEKNPGERVLVDVKCSRAVQDVVENLGGKIVWGKTGHSLIKSKMKEEKILFAGEMSGHIFFRDDFFGFDDALYAAGRLLQVLCETGRTVDDFLAEMPLYYNTPEIRLDCPEEKKDEVVQAAKEFFLKKYPKSQTIDGIRIAFEDGFALIRKSNTQAKIILRFEANTKAGLERIKKTVMGKVEEIYGEFNIGYFALQPKRRLHKVKKARQ